MDKFSNSNWKAGRLSMMESLFMMESLSIKYLDLKESLGKNKIVSKIRKYISFDLKYSFSSNQQ